MHRFASHLHQSGLATAKQMIKPKDPKKKKKVLVVVAALSCFLIIPVSTNVWRITWPVDSFGLSSGDINDMTTLGMACQEQ